MIPDNTIVCGDCLSVMRDIPDGSIDAVVTDPPYGLSFMGKDWDHGIPGEYFWREALRVAKPGTHLLAFGGTRTHHRLMVAIEDAGWEIRDCLGWLYGSGFPKSHNVSKAMDKAAGAEREVVGYRGDTMPDIRGNSSNNRGIGGIENEGRERLSVPITAPATDAARQWDGWGTALKPAWEPIILARKPLEGTVAENVQKYGTGALNIDGGRIELEAYSRLLKGGSYSGNRTGSNVASAFNSGNEKIEYNIPPARWPANILHDGSDEVLAVFPENAARFFYCAKASKRDRNDGLEDMPRIAPERRDDGQTRGMSTSQFRPDGSERKPVALRRNTHPTVKPTALMQYLCRLITPPGGLILDPFLGSGTTAVAALRTERRFIGIEISETYCEIARKRVAAELAQGKLDFDAPAPRASNRQDGFFDV